MAMSWDGVKNKNVFFSHDRFQQTFYTILSEQERSKIHYALAKYYEQIYLQNENPQLQFIIADNYSKGLNIIETEREKRICLLLLYAASAAARLSALETSAGYLEQIIQILDTLQKDETFCF